MIYPHVKTGRLRGIGVTSLKRSSAMPEIPAIAETVPGYEHLSWQAVLGPKALPKAIAARWNSEMNRVLELPEIRARLAADGVEPAGGSPQRFYELLRHDVAKWQKVVKAANVESWADSGPRRQRRGRERDRSDGGRRFARTRRPEHEHRPGSGRHRVRALSA